MSKLQKILIIRIQIGHSGLLKSTQVHIQIFWTKSHGNNSLIVVKKITVNYARKICEKIQSDLDELRLELKDNSGKNINSSLKFKDKTFHAEVNESNLFYALDKVLAQLLNDAQ